MTISHLTRARLPQFGQALGGSEHQDVTGGMAAKVEAMLALCDRVPGLSVLVFSGDEPGVIRKALLDDTFSPGTRLTA
jgi:isopentenyl phosphate kinase